MALIGIAFLALAACGRSDSFGTSAAAVTTQVWVDESAGYTFNCADQCGDPSCPTTCIDNRCIGDVRGQPCEPLGAQCNLVVPPLWRVLECEARFQGTWTRTEVTLCSDICNTSSCARCIQNRCSGNPEGQPCSQPNASCNVVSASSFVTLVCE